MIKLKGSSCKLCLLYIRNPNEWRCAFCDKETDDSDYTLDTVTVIKLLSNGYLTNGDGDKFSICFFNKDGCEFSQFDQTICSDCIRLNEKEETCLLQPYFLERKIFTYTFIRENRPDAVFRSFIDGTIMKTNGDLFNKIMSSLSQNTMEKRRESAELMKAFEKSNQEINENAKFVYKGEKLKELTGLRRADFDEIVSHVRRFRRYFRSLEVEEVITAFFSYMRFLKLQFKMTNKNPRMNLSLEQLCIFINRNRQLAKMSSISRKMLSKYNKKG